MIAVGLWSDAEVATLRDLVGQRLSSRDIAAKIGRSEKAIVQKLSSLAKRAPDAPPPMRSHRWTETELATAISERLKGHTYRKIAGDLGLSPAQVKNRLHRYAAEQEIAALLTREAATGADTTDIITADGGYAEIKRERHQREDLIKERQRLRAERDARITARRAATEARIAAAHAAQVGHAPDWLAGYA